MSAYGETKQGREERDWREETEGKKGKIRIKTRTLINFAASVFVFPPQR